MTELRSIAHVRTGDKGDTCQISVIAFEPEDYPRLVSQLTSERVAEHFGALASGPVQRFALPQLHALIFVLERALRSGVTRSLSLDAHGKCIGSTLLSLQLPPLYPAAPTTSPESPTSR